MIVLCLTQKVRKLISDGRTVKELVESFPGARHISDEKVNYKDMEIFVEGNVEAIYRFSAHVDGTVNDSVV